MNSLHEFVWALPFVMYAETHYRFKYFVSYLRKPEPELIADAPHRIGPGAHIPILILAKDADKFPARITGVQVRCLKDGVVTRNIELLEQPINLNEPLWSKVFNLKRGQSAGWLELDVIITLETLRGLKTYRADNHRTSSHLPLRVFLSNERLPSFSGLHFGDAHTHSQYTDDQVEFGVPIDASVMLSKSMGLSFICIADHSYDLDDSINDYSTNDPATPKWKSLCKEIRNKNSMETDFVVVQGEEISCRNSKGKNVHLLLLGDDRFFHGSGDSAERWFNTRCEYSIDDILSLKNSAALAFAAHPMEAVSRLQQILLGRDSWSEGDLFDQRLAGNQFANGIEGNGFVNGYKTWIRCLLKGQRAYCLAGNDSHGNFNRFRQIGVPFFTIRERYTQLFGKMRTGVFIGDTVDRSHIMESLAEGRSLITDGPVANIVPTRDETIMTSIGSVSSGSEFEFAVVAKSSQEFGEITELKVFIGVIGADHEELFLSERLSGIFEHRRVFSVVVTSPSYVRAEVYSSVQNASDGRQHFCFTNPLWIGPKVSF